jgi:ketosteroid isomerase-like protein
LVEWYTCAAVRLKPYGLKAGNWKLEVTMVSRIASLLVLLAFASSLSAQAPADLQRQVRDAERAFAKTMADRDHTAFTAFVAEDAIFLAPKEVLRGRKAVADGWKKFFDGKQAPFAWEPERVEVNDSGTLALSTGPVMDPSGKRVGTFTSTWRREPDGRWRVVFDGGCP